MNFRNFKNSKAGFTLIELLIYSVLFVVAGGLVTGITLNIKKNTALNEAQRTVDAAFNDLERRLASAIENSVAVNSATDDALSLASATSETDNVFSLNGNSVYFREGTDSPNTITGANVNIDILNFKLTPAQSVNIDPINHWAYNDIFGWIDFGQTGNSIKIPAGAGDLTGVALGTGSGDIFFNCLSTDNCITSDYKVSVDKDGNLSGYAWSESMGWISFCGNSGGINGCTTSSIAYGVTINTNTGEFSGQAWSEVAGYISFNCITGGSGGTNVCSSSNYKVQDLRRKTTSVTADIKISYNVAPYQNTFRSGSVTFNLKQPSKVTVTSILPDSGTGTVSSITIGGTYFKTGAFVKLTHGGFKDIYPTINFSRDSVTALSGGVLNLTGFPSGAWDVMVINPDGQIGILKGGFTIGSAPTTTTTTTSTSTTTTTTILQGNGAVCTAGSQCSSGNCYVDNDSDRYTPASGTKTCRASTQLTGVDCNDSCATCYLGSTSYTTSPDGLDQDCNGIVDDTSSGDVTCTPGYGTSVIYGYNAGCQWVPGGTYHNMDFDSCYSVIPIDTTHCVPNGTSCTDYTGGWGQQSVNGPYGSHETDTITCNGFAWGSSWDVLPMERMCTINASPKTSCTQGATTIYH